MKEKIRMQHNWWLTQAKHNDGLSAEELVTLQDLKVEEEKGWFRIPVMPMQVHDVLLMEVIIENPWLPGKAKEYLWVAESDWIYRREIKGRGPGKRVYLDFKGIDTVADIFINGIHVAYHNDMYLQLKLDVTEYLKKVDNTMIVYFHSPFKYLDQNPLPAEWQDKMEHFQLIIKIPTDFSDYIGPKPYFAHIGLFADVVIETVDGVEITKAEIMHKIKDNLKTVDVSVNINGFGKMENTKVRVEILAPQGELIANTEEDVEFSDCEDWSINCSLRVENPMLWWPRGYGEQPLYQVNVIAQACGQEQDRVFEKLGFRQLEIDENLDTHVNGKRVKLYGANLASIDGVTLCWNSERVNRILDLVENANMNVMRIWAEGELYNDELYDECDKRGILLWHDFFTRGVIPNTTAIRALYKKEAEQLVVHLRHRPCILLWSGGNESTMWHHMNEEKYDFIGMEVINEDFRDVCEKFDPDRYYHFQSPCGGAYPNDPLMGDTHGYTNMWYIPGYDYIKFASEDTRISTPPLKSMKRVMGEENIWPSDYNAAKTPQTEYPWPDSWMEYTTCMSWKKMGPVERFYDSVDAESLIYRIASAHGLYFKETVEKNRRGRPSNLDSNDRFNNGYIVWKLNATWPQIYSAIIDYFLEPYIPYYILKRAYAPVLMSFDIENHIYLWVVNDSINDIEGTIKLKLFNIESNTVSAETERKVLVKSGESKNIMNLDEFQMIRKENILSAVLTDSNGYEIARANEFLDIERNIKFPDAKISLSIEGDVISITSDKFARCVELSGNDDGDEFGWIFEDNYFDLLPFETKKVEILGTHKKGRITAKAHFSDYITEVNYNLKE